MVPFVSSYLNNLYRNLNKRINIIIATTVGTENAIITLITVPSPASKVISIKDITLHTKIAIANINKNIKQPAIFPPHKSTWRLSLQVFASTFWDLSIKLLILYTF